MQQVVKDNQTMSKEFKTPDKGQMWNVDDLVLPNGQDLEKSTIMSSLSIIHDHIGDVWILYEG